MSLSTTWLSDIFEKVSETCLLHEQTGVFMTADLPDFPGLANRTFCVIPVHGLNNEKGLLFCEDVKKNFKYEELQQCGVMSPFADRPDESLGVHGEVFTDTTLTGNDIRALCNVLHMRYCEKDNPLFEVEEILLPAPGTGNPIHELKTFDLPETDLDGRPEAMHKPQRTLH